ncbi:MAG TPA: hypothetical protein VJY33_24505 [Isosphaeraceae bacterium]|nr:hypothetical protein [Isosphaeraceae bacterium]
MACNVEVCNESDESDPDYGEPETWGLWADWHVYELGPGLPVTKDEDIVQLCQLERLRTAFDAWLTTPAAPE